MSIPAWPATLPQYVENDASGTYPDVLLETPMETGPAKVRPRFTAAPEACACRLLLVGDQRAAFRAFWKDTLSHGALRFTWTHPQTHAAATVRFKAGSVKWAKPVGQTLEVSFTLEVLP